MLLRPLPPGALAAFGVVLAAGLLERETTAALEEWLLRWLSADSEWPSWSASVRMQRIGEMVRMVRLIASQGAVVNEWRDACAVSENLLAPALPLPFRRGTETYGVGLLPPHMLTRTLRRQTGAYQQMVATSLSGSVSVARMWRELLPALRRSWWRTTPHITSTAP